MGNKEAKFKEMFEEIDTSGDGKVSFNELAVFIVSPKAVNQLKANLFQKGYFPKCVYPLFCQFLGEFLS